MFRLKLENIFSLNVYSNLNEGYANKGARNDNFTQIENFLKFPLLLKKVLSDDLMLKLSSSSARHLYNKMKKNKNKEPDVNETTSMYVHMYNKGREHLYVL